MKNGYLVGIGELLWDLLPDGKKIGGAPGNFAYHASQFGYNGAVVSAVGGDRLGDEILENICDKGLKCSIERVAYPTGSVQVTLDVNGVPIYDIKENVAWDNIPYTEKLEQIAKETLAVSFGSLAQRNVVTRETINKFLDAVPYEMGRYIIFDINLRQGFYTKGIVCNSMERCNVLKINDEELAAISLMFGYSDIDLQNKCWTILAKFKLELLVLTCGVNGSYVFMPGDVSFVATPKVDVVDTVGAGDSFTATFITSLLSGDSVRNAHIKAVRVSAYVCTHSGAMPIIPDYLK